jgi:hypothetical protein
MIAELNIVDHEEAGDDGGRGTPTIYIVGRVSQATI